MSLQDERIAHLGEAVAVLKQRSDDHEGDIRAFGPLVTEHVRLEERTAGLQVALDGVRSSVAELVRKHDDRDQRDEERDRQVRQFRVTTYISFVGLLVAFGGTVIALLVFLQAGR